MQKTANILSHIASIVSSSAHCSWVGPQNCQNTTRATIT